MICAHCGHESPKDACPECGRPPWLDGRYRLDAILREGAGWTTWRGSVRGEDLAVEVREVRLRTGLSGIQRAALVEEASTLRRVQQPGLARWLEVFQGRSGPHPVLYAVTERVEGRSLHHELRQSRLPPDEAMRTIEEVAATLAGLHGLEPPVVHGDLRLEHAIRRARDGRVVLVEPVPPGLAARMANATGGALGAAGTTAPEQLQGRIECASDLYSLGVIAAALLASRTVPELLGSDGSLRWQRLVQVPPPVEDLLSRLVDSHPERRPTADEALAQLRAHRGVAPTGDDVDPFEDTMPMSVFSDETTLIETGGSKVSLALVIALIGAIVVLAMAVLLPTCGA